MLKLKGNNFEIYSDLYDGHWLVYVELEQDHSLFEEIREISMWGGLESQCPEDLSELFHGGCTYADVNEEVAVFGCDYTHKDDFSATGEYLVDTDQVSRDMDELFQLLSQ